MATNRPAYSCSISGCGKPGFCRGWCSAHYTMNRRYGDPLHALTPEFMAHRHALRSENAKRNHPRYWLGKKRPPPSLATRAKMSAAHLALNYRGRNHHRFGKTPAHVRRFEYNGTLFRSSYEARFAQLLDSCGVRWVYEPQRFDLGITTYLPDFWLPEYRCWYEIKGWLTESAQQKLSLFRQRFPRERLILVPKQFFRHLRQLDAIA